MSDKPHPTLFPGMTQKDIEQYEQYLKEEEEKERIQLENEKDAFFAYYVIDYTATGEGRTIYLFVERNYNEQDILDSIKETAGPYYFKSLQRVSEEKFMTHYSSFIPGQVKRMIEKKNVPMFSFHQQFHFNYS